MANAFLTPDIVAAEALKRLKHALVFPRLFRPAASVPDLGAQFNFKIGQSYKVKRPYYANITKGATLANSSYSDLVDRYIEISVGERYHGALRLNTEELTFELVDYSARYLKPVIEALAYQYDKESAENIIANLGYSQGTFGSQFDFAEAQRLRAHAANMAMPASNRWLVMSPRDVAALGIEIQRGQPEASTAAYHGGFNNGSLIEDALRSSFAGMVAGFQLYESTQMPPVTVIKMGAPKVNNGGGYVGNRLPTDSWGANNTKVLNKGQLITINNVSHTKPRQGAETTGEAATFVVREDVTTNGSGQATIPIFPEINDGSLIEDGGNVGAWRTTNAPAADDAVITVLGVNGKTYYRGMAGVPDTGVSIPVRIEAPPAALNEGNAFHQTDPETGLSVLITRDWNQTSLDNIDRLDAYVTANIYFAETGMQILSSEKTN